jgi:hypothetical protein
MLSGTLHIFAERGERERWERETGRQGEEEEEEEEERERERERERKRERERERERKREREKRRFDLQSNSSCLLNVPIAFQSYFVCLDRSSYRSSLDSSSESALLDPESASFSELALLEKLHGGIRSRIRVLWIGDRKWDKGCTYYRMTDMYL